jgi:hypothetical protein
MIIKGVGRWTSDGTWQAAFAVRQRDGRVVVDGWAEYGDARDGARGVRVEAGVTVDADAIPSAIQSVAQGLCEALADDHEATARVRELIWSAQRECVSV